MKDKLVRLGITLFILVGWYLAGYDHFNRKMNKWEVGNSFAPVPMEYKHEIWKGFASFEDKSYVEETPVFWMVKGAGSYNAIVVNDSLSSPYIAVTEGALRGLSFKELTALLAHEWSHLEYPNLDIDSTNHYIIDRRAAELTSRDAVLGLLRTLRNEMIKFRTENKFWFELYPFRVDRFPRRISGFNRRIEKISALPIKQ